MSGVKSGDSAADAREIRVLHVEDDEAYADLATTFLERDEGGRQLSVVTETDPRRAVDHLPEVDCVVSDYDMPGMDGLEVLDAVRDVEPDVPFVLFTGRGSEEIASDAISAGVTDYLRKGSGSDQFAVLANAVRNAVSRRRAEREAEASRRRLRRTLDLLPQYVVVKTVSGRYHLVNDAAAAHYDCAPGEVEGRNEAEFIRDDLVERFRAEDREVAASGDPLHIDEQRVTNVSGVERVENVTKIPFDLPEADEPAVLVVAEDVTERVERERCIDGVTDAVADARAAFEDVDADCDAAARLDAALAEAASLVGTDGKADAAVDD